MQMRSGSGTNLAAHHHIALILYPPLSLVRSMIQTQMLMIKSLDIMSRFEHPTNLMYLHANL
jgi:hypothetical protein